jgi:hypothetical protein
MFHNSVLAFLLRFPGATKFYKTISNNNFTYFLTNISVLLSVLRKQYLTSSDLHTQLRLLWLLCCTNLYCTDVLHMSCTRKLLHCAPSLHIQYIYFEWGMGIQKFNTYLYIWKSSMRQTLIMNISSSFKYTTFCFVCIANYLSFEENTVHFI